MRAQELDRLYRQADGRIGREEWLRASAAPVGLALLLTLIAYLIAPGPRDLSSQPFFSLWILFVHAYYIVYGFALILLAVAEYFVSAKRFNDLGRSPGWAGAAPFLLFVAAATAWFAQRAPDLMPGWAEYPVFAAALAAVVWTAAELGFRPSREG